MNEKRYKIRSRKWCKIRPGKLCKRKQTQSISAMNSQSSINWVKLLQSLAENCCKVWRKCCRNQPRKVRPEMLQKSAEKGSEIGREKFGRKRSAAKGRPQKVGREIVANSTGTQLWSIFTCYELWEQYQLGTVTKFEPDSFQPISCIVINLIGNKLQNSNLLLKNINRSFNLVGCLSKCWSGGFNLLMGGHGRSEPRGLL